MTLIVGLTGGIGSGKSIVADAFAERGVEVTDTDRLAHVLTTPGEPGYAPVIDAFGPAFSRPDGTLDRARLRELVFTNDDARGRLEAILHPLIREAAAKEMAGWIGPYGVLVVPLLLERAGASPVDRVLVVDCPEQIQVQRVAKRSALSEAEVRAIMATQLPRAERLARADDVLDNSGPLSAIAPQVAALDRRYRELSAATSRGTSRG